MIKVWIWMLVLGLLVGCAPQDGSPSLENTVNIATNDEDHSENKSWDVISEIDFGQPSISTQFRDESYGLTTDLGGGIHITLDGGQTWDFKQVAASSRVALEIVDENLIWHIGVGGPVIRSLDGGDTWEYLGPVPHGGHTEYTSFIDEDHGWAATTERGVYWHTNDGAQTWQAYPLPENMGTVAALHLRTLEEGYLLDLEGNLFVTSDGGENWQTKTLGLEQGWQIPELNHSAAMRFTDKNNGLVALNILGKGSSRTYALRTTDGGESWVEEQLPVGIGMFHLTRDGRYLTHVDLFDHGRFILLRSTGAETAK